MDKGYLWLNPNTTIRQAIKIQGNSTIGYAYIGHYANQTGNENWDILVGVLDENGNRIPNWPEKKFSETDLVNLNLYVDITSGGVDIPFCTDITEEEYENTWQDGWDIVSDQEYLFLSCKFDWVIADFNSQCLNPNYQNDLDRYEYVDLALVKLKMDINNNKFNIEKAINVGISDAPEFFPDLEIKNGEIFILGGTTKLENDEVIVDGTLKVFNTNLDLLEEKNFSSPKDKSNNLPSQIGWNINCAFDMDFNCNGELIVAGNNELNDEDYFFYKFSNRCQAKEDYSGVHDITILQEVSGNENWNFDRKVKATVVIKSGGTLTISSGATIQFGASWDLVDYDELKSNYSTKAPRIIVQGGGTLNLIDCTLRGISNCGGNSMWDGIEVLNQGILNMTNGATIQDAKIGILVGKGYYSGVGTSDLVPNFGYGGGTITLNGANVTNCNIGVHFSSCTSNSSTITSSNFLCTDFLKDPIYKTINPNFSQPFTSVQKLGTQIFIRANYTTGISIQGGSINNVSLVPALQRGIGISTFSARNMNIGGGLNISNLNKGMHISSTGTLRFVTVDDVNFNANMEGIRLTGGGGHVVRNNDFSCVYKNSLDPAYPATSPGVGIANQASFLTKMEENSFTAGISNNKAGVIGIISENTGSGSNIHKKNHFVNMDRGDQTQRLNAGLNLWCNDYTNTDKAWAININNASSAAFKDQGECLQTRKLFPDNDFIDNCNSSLIHIHSNLGFTYWKNSSENKPPELPCSQNVTLKVINSVQDCNSNAELKSGCDAIIPITGLNDDYYYDLVPTLPNGDQRQGIVNDLIRYYTGTNETERINTLLQNESNENYKMSYAELLLDQGNVIGAVAVANSINNSSPEASDYMAYFGVLVYAKQNNLNLDQLTQSKILLLESISTNRTIGAYNSQAILSTYYGYNYPLIVETASGLEYREKVVDKKEFNLQLTTLVPNPTNNSVRISTNIRSKFITSVSILSLDGRELMKSSFRGIQSTENIDVSQLNPGIFIIKLETNSGLNPELIKLIKE